MASSLETKMAYAKPQVQRIGSIEDLTRATGGSGNLDGTFANGTFTGVSDPEGDGNANFFS